MSYNYTTWLELLGVCVLNMVLQNMYTYLNQNTNPARVGLLMYIQILYSFLADTLIFKQSFTNMELIGVSICLVFSFGAGIFKYIISKRIETQKKKLAYKQV